MNLVRVKLTCTDQCIYHCSAFKIPCYRLPVCIFSMQRYASAVLAKALCLSVETDERIKMVVGMRAYFDLRCALRKFTYFRK